MKNKIDKIVWLLNCVNSQLISLIGNKKTKKSNEHT